MVYYHKGLVVRIAFPCHYDAYIYMYIYIYIYIYIWWEYDQIKQSCVDSPMCVTFIYQTLTKFWLKVPRVVRLAWKILIIYMQYTLKYPVFCFYGSSHILLLWFCCEYCQISNIIRTLCNKIVRHSDVVGASPVGAAPTTSSFCT